MTAKTIRNILFATAIATTTAVVGAAGPAYAVPVPGPNESITFVYYATSAKTTVVGGWTYGNCLEDFEWGRRTAYSTWKRTVCNDPN